MEGSEDVNMKELRLKNSSGWIDLVTNENLVFAIDAILDLQPEHEGTVENFAQLAGLSEKEAFSALQTLSDFGVVELTGDGEYKTRPSTESIVRKELYHLNSALNRKRSEMKDTN